MTAIAISTIAAAWLSACAICDARTRQVPNRLTLPAIPLALLATSLSYDGRGDTLFTTVFSLMVILLPTLAAWRGGLLGGADFKILLALALLHPALVVAAWLGAAVYFAALALLRRSRPARFAGVPGFALGVGTLAACQFTLAACQFTLAACQFTLAAFQLWL